MAKQASMENIWQEGYFRCARTVDELRERVRQLEEQLAARLEIDAVDYDDDGPEAICCIYAARRPVLADGKTERLMGSGRGKSQQDAFASARKDLSRRIRAVKDGRR